MGRERKRYIEPQGKLNRQGGDDDLGERDDTRTELGIVQGLPVVVQSDELTGGGDIQEIDRPDAVSLRLGRAST